MKSNLREHGLCRPQNTRARTSGAAGVFLAALLLACGVHTGLAMSGRPRQADFTHRLVFVRSSLSEDRHVEDIRGIVERSSRLGFNGVALSSGFDAIGVLGEDFRERLRQINAICRDEGMALIPLLFSVGYGGALAHDRNLAAAAPLRSVPFVIENGRGVLVEDRAIGITNGDIERVEGHMLEGFNLQDGPGRVSFRDPIEYREGKSSLRLENFAAVPHGMGRVMQEIAVRPFRCYRVALWVKIDKLDPVGSFQVLVMTKDGRVLTEFRPSLAPTGDWREVSVGFNSLDYEKVRVYAGVWGGRSGRVWIDDIRVEGTGLVNVIRRPGTPVAVRSAETGAVYGEGEDFERIEDRVLSYKLDHEGAALVPLPGGRIREGERLLVDCYQALSMKHEAGQVGVCMSEARVYEIWEETAALVHETIAPDHYFLSMDEIRQGGWCEACRSRALTAGEMLGECITRQREIIRGVNPRAEVFVWSDMLDPNHNARDRYYVFNGNFGGSWDHIPKDLIVACWYYDIRDKSLRHFDERGFRTIGCGYYDGDDEKAVEGWVASLSRTPGSCGIMYTTWSGRYDFLEAFATIALRGRPASNDRK